jgi:hypothetical protein
LTARLALTLGGGAIIGVLVLLAAAAAGKGERKWHFGLGGTAWGFALAWMALADCPGPGATPGQMSNIAFPVLLGGLVIWPVVMAWGQPRWFWRWLAAQLVVALALAPAFVLGVLVALCNFT